MKLKLIPSLINIVLALFGYKKKPYIQGELDALIKKADEKKQAASDALNAGNIPMHHKFHGEWLQLCGQIGRLRARLEKD